MESLHVTGYNVARNVKAVSKVILNADDTGDADLHVFYIANNQVYDGFLYIYYLCKSMPSVSSVFF